MKREPSIFDVTDGRADARREAEALADIEVDRVIPNDEVCAWLKTWGTPDEKPAAEKWFKEAGHDTHRRVYSEAIVILSPVDPTKSRTLKSGPGSLS